MTEPIYSPHLIIGIINLLCLSSFPKLPVILMKGPGLKKKKWELTIASDPANITIVEQFLNDLYNETDWNEEIQANIGIATTEIVNNAILHGNKSKSDLEVYICVCLSEKEIVIQIKDEGCCQDEIETPNPTLPDNLMKTNGRGLFLVEHFMDEVDLTNTKEGTTVTMKLFFSK